MNFLKIAWRDISSIFKNRFIRISVTAIIVVPLLYSLLYLAAFWDPYGKLQNMPVAVVNLDKGATNDGEEVNYGKDVIERLKTNKQVGWKFVSYDEADKGVNKTKKYYAEFIIPEDFSEKIIQVNDGKLQHPSILYKDNEKTNFLAGQINERVSLEFKDEINKNITKTMTEVAFNSLNDVKKGFADAADGSSQLKDGIDSAKTGTSQLASGTQELYSKVPALTSGISQLDNGGKTLNSGIGIERNGIITLNSGIQQSGNSILNVINNLGSNKIFAYASDSRNIANAKKLTADASALKNIDTSGLANAGTLLNSQNLGLLNTTMNDVSKIDINKINALMKNANLTPTEMQNLQKLLQDSGNAMSSIGDPNNASKLQSLQALLNTQNAAEIRNILAQASSLSNVDTDSMQKFLTAQLAQIDKYNAQDTTALTSVDNKNALEAVIDAAYPTGVNAQQTAVNTKFKTLIEGYYKIVTTNDATMRSPQLKGTLTGMQTTVSGLSTVKNTLKNDSGLIQGMSMALSDTNVQYINQMLGQLINLQSEFAANSQSITKIQTLLGSLDPNQVSATLSQVNAIQQDITAAKPMLTALSSPQMQTQLANAPKVLNQLTSMKNDLDVNQKLLDAAGEALSDNNIAQAQSIIAAIPSYKDKINTLKNGTSQLENGINQIYTGSGQLSSGLTTLNGNTSLLANGVNKLNDGSQQLDSGLAKLSDGAGSLNSGLKDGSDKISSKLKSSSSDMGSFVSEPTKLNESPINHIKNYGTGFAPYFIPLSLWVGAIMMFFIITDKIDDDINAGSFGLVAGKYISYCFIGTLQAVLVSVAVLCLGLRPHNIVLYFVFNIFMSYVFIAIIQSLVFLLGMAGRLLSIVLLMLQLTSCAGTFPLEIIPKFFRVMYPFMPFTYCVSALRETITGTNYAVFGKNVGVLAGVLVVFLIISVLMKGHADNVQARIKAKEAAAGMTV